MFIKVNRSLSSSIENRNKKNLAETRAGKALLAYTETDLVFYFAARLHPLFFLYSAVRRDHGRESPTSRDTEILVP